MPVRENLNGILDRIVAGTHTDADIESLRQGLIVAEEQNVVQLGQYNVNIDEARNVQIGDRVYQGPEAEAMRQAFQQALGSLTPRALLTHGEFAARAERAALASHAQILVAREDVLETVSADLAAPGRLVVLHGSGGVGKTRLLLALPQIVPDGMCLSYVRSEAESIEHDLASLDLSGQHVLVVDDAHRLSPLRHLHEVFVNPEFVDRVRLVLATRSVFKDAVPYRLGHVPGDQVSMIEVGALTNADIDRLLQNPPYNIATEGTRHTLVRIAQGNPLIASIGARLVQRGASMAGLTRDQVLTRYLDEIIHDLAEVGYDDRYIDYLQVLAALGTVDLSNGPLRERLQQVVGVSPSEEERMVARLADAGLVERYWMKIKMGSEVMADHILAHHFFDPEMKRADYEKQIVEPFLALKPKEVLTNLALAEVKGESPQAGLLLDQKLIELQRIVSSEGNIARLSVLHWLQGVSYLRPDEVLLIAAHIVDQPEQPPESFHDPWWGSRDVTHDMVLSKAVEILSRITHRGHVRDAIRYLFIIAQYRPETQEYARVREGARNALVEIATFELRKPYEVQLSLLDMIRTRLAEDFASTLDLALALLQPMLSMEYVRSEADPTQPFAVVIQEGILSPAEPLRRIRAQVLEVLYAAYQKTSTLTERLKLIKAMDQAVPRFRPDAQVSNEIWAWLEPDCVNTACFFSDMVVPEAELPVMDAVAEWLWRARRFGDYQADQLEHLGQQLTEHRLFQLYRLLVGWHRWDQEDEHPNLRRSEERRRQGVDQYVQALSPDTLEETVRDLEMIAAQASAVGETGMNWLNTLLRDLGRTRPDLGAQLVEQAVAEDLVLKQHLGFAIAGLRAGAPETALGYTSLWAAGDEAVLWLAVARSYRFAEWDSFQPQEWDTLLDLVGKECPSVDYEMLSFMWQWAPHNPPLAVAVLRALAARGDERMLSQVAMVLVWPNENRDGWAVEFEEPQDYLDIVQHFERLSSLDFYTEESLNRLGEIHPMHVIDFIERRISAVAERRVQDERYGAIPFRFSQPMHTLSSSSEYPDVLRRVRDWMLREDPWFRFYTPRVLRAISPELAGPLCTVLLEWVQSGDVEKWKAVVAILHELNAGDEFYSLIREIICQTDDDSVLSSVRGAIGSTPGAISGPFSGFWSQRLAEVSRWLDDENHRVRLFAERTMRWLQNQLEMEQAGEELERREW
ncbi:MAG TPA: hypothetical protein VM537_08385 [Anaerolineae bacterium]|nr:hypothetical protein [Anaerolineae bacterium]